MIMKIINGMTGHWTDTGHNFHDDSHGYVNYTSIKSFESLDGWSGRWNTCIQNPSGKIVHYMVKKKYDKPYPFSLFRRYKEIRTEGKEEKNLQLDAFYYTLLGNGTRTQSPHYFNKSEKKVPLEQQLFECKQCKLGPYKAGDLKQEGWDGAKSPCCNADVNQLVDEQEEPKTPLNAQKLLKEYNRYINTKTSRGVLCDPTLYDSEIDAFLKEYKGEPEGDVEIKTDESPIGQLTIDFIIDMIKEQCVLYKIDYPTTALLTNAVADALQTSPHKLAEQQEEQLLSPEAMKLIKKYALCFTDENTVDCIIGALSFKNEKPKGETPDQILDNYFGILYRTLSSTVPEHNNPIHQGAFAVLKAAKKGLSQLSETGDINRAHDEGLHKELEEELCKLKSKNQTCEKCKEHIDTINGGAHVNAALMREIDKLKNQSTTGFSLQQVRTAMDQILTYVGNPGKDKVIEKLNELKTNMPDSLNLLIDFHCWISGKDGAGDYSMGRELAEKYLQNKKDKE